MFLVAARASHAAVIQDNVMWVYGGYSFDGKSNDLLRLVDLLFPIRCTNV